MKPLDLESNSVEARLWIAKMFAVCLKRAWELQLEGKSLAAAIDEVNIVIEELEDEQRGKGKDRGAGSTDGVGDGPE